MICGNCGTQNRAGRRFCLNCGQPLQTGCPNCGAENEPEARFCGNCGQALAAAVSPASPQAGQTPGATLA
ncbi:MAG: zinc ribbon domain-containing protein, partial [Chloroflexota bacterium]|nr:zinc ribbon domain-containing protein [Chloroflexota bacterium]